MTRFIALDFETGGLDPNRNAPVSLGCAIFEGGQVAQKQEWIIGPTLHWKTGKIERVYEVNALEISGISWPRIKSAPKPNVIVAEMTKWAKEHDATKLPIVAFRASFDFGFYSSLLFLASDWHPSIKGVKVQPRPPLIGPWYCALQIAQSQLTLDDYRLDTVAGHFGLSRASDLHGALEDAILAGQVFLKMLEGEK